MKGVYILQACFPDCHLITALQPILSLTNGFSHYYHLSDSTFIFRGTRCVQFFDENSLSKQKKSLRWDAAFRRVTSGAILFACVPKRDEFEQHCVQCGITSDHMTEWGFISLSQSWDLA